MNAARRLRGSGPAPRPVWILAAPVRNWMHVPVVTIGAGTPVREAAALMRARKIRHLPVLDEAGRLAGIVTDRDLRQVVFDAALRGRLGEEAERLGDTPVREIMTWGAARAPEPAGQRSRARRRPAQRRV